MKSSEFEEIKDKYDLEQIHVNNIEGLEDFIKSSNYYANMVNQGHVQYEKEMVSDDLYDRAVEALREVKPQSEVLTKYWEDVTEENSVDDQVSNYYLSTYPMKSIATVKDLTGATYQNFLNLLDKDKKYPIIMESKLNGHGIRVVYKDGTFYGAYTRSRNTQGRDITKVLRVILAKYGLLTIPTYQGIGSVVELRGELIMDTGVFEEHAGSINAVSPLFAVASLSRESASIDEYSLLDFIPYRLHMVEQTGNLVEYSSRYDEFEHIANLGFYKTSPELPMKLTYLTGEQIADQKYMENVSHNMYEYIDSYQQDSPIDSYGSKRQFGYYTDGIVFEINDESIFDSMNGDTKYDYGNVALKIGDWSQTGYYGFIQMIRWTGGKSKYTPVAIIADSKSKIIFEYEGKEYKGFNELNQKLLLTEKYTGDIWSLVKNKRELGVITGNGSKVTRVPLYSPYNLFKLNIVVDSKIRFRFGTEAGVLPLTKEGKRISEI